MSEALEPESSDSLETMLGFSTETGRATALTPSSSSGTQALSNRPWTPVKVAAQQLPQWSGPGLPWFHGPSLAFGNIAALAVSGQAPRRNLPPL